MDVSSHVVAGIAVVLIAITMLRKPSKLHEIPTVGSSGLLGSWYAGFKYLTNAVDIIRKGYEEYKLAPFKVKAIHRWLIVLNSPEHVEELQRAPADTLSFAAAINDLQREYTMGPEIHQNPYHLPILRSQLTRNLGVWYPEIRDEVITAFDDVLDLKGKEWKSVPALRSIQQVICRTSNRVFVGLPLCRDPDWADLNIQYTIDVVKGSIIIALFPDFLKPMVTRLFTNTYKSKQRGKKLLGPIIEERQRCLDKYGREWTDKPNDLLSWLMEEAEGPELTVKYLTTHILAINVASIHTTSSSFTHALFYLAANPQYVQPLRKEVERIVEMEGWSKTALGKMRKVDSFLKECQRIESINYVSLHCKALKDFTFSDGTFVPKGTMIGTAAQLIHHNEAFYQNAHVFEPFRFAHLSEEDGAGVKHQYVLTSVEYLPFGHGWQACPGRFFVGTELKTMLAHVVITYDVKLEGNGTQRPQPLRFVTSLLPNPIAKVMFRKRVD